MNFLVLLAAEALFLSPAAFCSAETASRYGGNLRNRAMANGKPFDPAAFTAASWFFPLGSKVRVQYRDRHVDVTITDRGPARRLVRRGRTLDLSRAAFSKLAPLRFGVIPVTITKL